MEEVAKEERISRATECMLQKLDSQSQQVSSASRADIKSGETIDIHEVESLLAWVSVSIAKRKSKVYPTRSFLVWAIAFILADLGFVIEASTTAITTVEQYSAFVEKNDSPPAPTVYFVGASVGRTDLGRISRQDVHVVPKYRYIPIHAIPAVELREHFLQKRLHKEQVFSMWKSTFEHVQRYLTRLPHIREMMGLPGLSENNTNPLAQGEGVMKPKVLSEYQRKGILQLSHSWARSSPESLEALLAPLISINLPKECPDCTNLCSSDHPVDSCWSDETSEPEGVSSNHNQHARLCLNAILLATSYAIACLFLKEGDSLANLDTEVVFKPSEVKSIGNCFKLGDWCDNMMSIAAVGVAQKYSTKVDAGLVRFKKSLFAVISGFEGGQFTSPGTFGCFANGVSMISLFLLQPMHPASYLAFAKQFGQLLDLPLEENGLIESVENQTSFKPCESSPASNLLQVLEPGDHEPLGMQTTRWDIEPDWASSSQNIHFRCRLAGIPQISLSPQWLQQYSRLSPRVSRHGTVRPYPTGS